MPRSRLWPYRDDIAEALRAGTSRRALARTYGVRLNAMQEFISRHIGDGVYAASQDERKNRRREDAAYRLQENMRDTLRHSRNAITRADERAERMVS